LLISSCFLLRSSYTLPGDPFAVLLETVVEQEEGLLREVTLDGCPVTLCFAFDKCEPAVWASQTTGGHRQCAIKQIAEKRRPREPEWDQGGKWMWQHNADG
jgi:hypothetical protein